MLIRRYLRLKLGKTYQESAVKLISCDLMRGASYFIRLMLSSFYHLLEFIIYELGAKLSLFDFQPILLLHVTREVFSQACTCLLEEKPHLETSYFLHHLIEFIDRLSDFI